MSSTAASQAQIKEHFADANLGHFYIESSFLANSAGAIGYPSDGKKKKKPKPYTLYKEIIHKDLLQTNKL